MRKKVSHFFAPLWPILIILSLHSLFSLFLPPQVNPLLLYGLVFISDLTAFFLYTHQVKKGGDHRKGLLKGLLLFLILSWLLYKLLCGEFFLANPSPLTPGSLYVFLFCTLGWLLTLLYTRPLIYWDEIMEILDRIESEKLSSKIMQYSFEIQKIKDVIKKVRLFTVSFTTLCVLLLVIFSFATSRLYPFQVMIILIEVIFCFCFIFFTRGLDEETRLMSQGIKLNSHWTFLKNRRFFLIIILLTIPSFWLAQSDIHLSLSFLEPISLTELIPQIHRSNHGMGIALALPLSGGHPISEATIKVLQYVFGGTFFTLFLLFLLFPFLWEKRERVKKNRFKRAGMKGIEYFSHLKEFLIPKGINEEKSSKKQVAAHKVLEKQGLPSARRVLRRWNRVYRWGEKRGYPLPVGASPSSYIRSLIENFPHRKDDLLSMALFLDRYFYSNQIIDIKNIEDFIKKTKSLIKEEKK